MSGSLAAVELALQDGTAHPNQRDSFGRTALHVVLGHGRGDFARLLLDRGWTMDARDVFGMTPIVYAAARGHSALLVELRAERSPASSRARDESASTAGVALRSGSPARSSTRRRNPTYVLLYLAILAGVVSVFFVSLLPQLRSRRALADAQWTARMVSGAMQLSLAFGLAAHVAAWGLDPGFVTAARSKGLSEAGDSAAAEMCALCDLWRPARAHHCRTCGQCCELFDHHCVWIDNCVGRGNFVPFLAFLLGTLATVGVYLVGLALTLWTDERRATSLTWLAIVTREQPYGLVAGAVASVFGLWIAAMTHDQVTGLLGNATVYERMHRWREPMAAFGPPYHHASTLANVRARCGCPPHREGAPWEGNAAAAAFLARRAAATAAVAPSPTA